MHGQTQRYELKSPTNWTTSSCIVCQVLLIPERALLPKPRTMVEIHFFVSLFLALCQRGLSKNRADEKKKRNKETSDYILNWSTWHKLGILCPTPWHVVQFIFHISLPSLKKHHLYSHFKKFTLFHGLQWRICSLPKAPPWGFVMTLPPWDLCNIFSKKWQTP